MRFVSQYPGYAPQIRVQRQRALGDGGVEVLTPGLYIKFVSVADGGMVYENERIAALNHFNFHGNTQDIGEAIPTDPLNRISVFDTDEAAVKEDWSAEDKALVEAKLTELALTTPTEILLVADTPISAPFPNYDAWDGDATALIVKLIEDGFDLEVVLAYESIFGPKREDVIEALEQGIEIGKEEIVTA